MATLTARDNEILLAAWDCFKSPVQVDYHKLAEVAKFKNSASASVCFGGVKKKLLGGKPLTARDCEILVLGWQSFKTAPQVDYKLLAEKANFKNAASASVCFGGVKKKLFGTTSETKATPKKRKANDEEIKEAKPKREKKAAEEEPKAEDDLFEGTEAEAEDTIKIKREETPELF